MKCTQLSRTAAWPVATVALTLTLATSAFAGKYTVIHAFTGLKDGGNPAGNLISDAAGNFYGTASWGGSHGMGVVFRLKPTASGGTYTVLYDFPSSGAAGTEPGPVTLDAAGNLYGVMSAGGSFGSGLVFEVSPTTSGPWQGRILYQFTGLTDGGSPIGSLVVDGAGNLYGVTVNGGQSFNCSPYCGTAFKLSPNSSGGWTETVIHNFDGGTDVHSPSAGLIFDAAGNLYGTGHDGGANSCRCGAIFELTPGSSGWTETLLYTFTDQADGAFPAASLMMDSAGNLYGTTTSGGNGGGTIFELSKTDGTLNVLHSFGSLQNTYYPVTLNAAGSLFGTTGVGGVDSLGTVFSLSPVSGGSWPLTVVHTFTGGKDGGSPRSGLLMDSAGNLYGSAIGGGNADCSNQGGCGVLFQLSF